MSKKSFKKLFDKEYEKLVLSELLIAFMGKNKISVRLLAKQINVAPSVIQSVRSGKHSNLTLKNFQKIMNALGAEITIKKGRQLIPLKLVA